MVSPSQFVEAAPATNGQELVVGRRTDGMTKLSRQPKDRLTTRAKGLVNRAAFQFPGIGIQGQDAEPELPNELSDWSVDTEIGQVDGSLCSQTAGLTKVCKLRSVIGSFLGLATQLRSCNDGDL